MSNYLDEELRKRKRALLYIIKQDDLKAIYIRVTGDKTFYSSTVYRYKMLKDWELFSDEIKNWASAIWEGF